INGKNSELEFVFVVVVLFFFTQYAVLHATEAESRTAGSLAMIPPPWLHLHEDYDVITSVQQILEKPGEFGYWVSLFTFKPIVPKPNLILIIHNMMMLMRGYGYS
ncbi:hypothetical protein A2U01_0060616, partial [Trifolium medium]|nr:hypothetical protein [Trifolium medium]